MQNSVGSRKFAVLDECGALKWHVEGRGKSNSHVPKISNRSRLNSLLIRNICLHGPTSIPRSLVPSIPARIAVVVLGQIQMITPKAHGRARTVLFGTCLSISFSHSSSEMFQYDRGQESLSGTWKLRLAQPTSSHM